MNNNSYNRGEGMESITVIQELSDFYKIFSDYTRLRILEYLFTGKRCVNEISEELNISQSAVSHQLKTLRQSNLVKTDKIGQMVYYELSDDHIKKIFACGIEHIKERL